jgi:DNA-binding NarL/FixJ family response regulator
MRQRELGAVVIRDAARPPDKPPMGIVGDRRLSLAALSALFLSDASYRLDAQARGGIDVVRLLEGARPALVVVDLSDGELLSLIDAKSWNGRVLLLLDPDADSETLSRAVAARPDGYLSRRASRTTLQRAIAVLQSTGCYFDPVLAAPLQAATRGTAPPRTSHAGLSHRERAVLVRIANGHSTKEIAREYAITPKTVANHVNNLSHKLHTRHRGQLILYAAHVGLTTI